MGNSIAGLVAIMALAIVLFIVLSDQSRHRSLRSFS